MLNLFRPPLDHPLTPLFQDPTLGKGGGVVFDPDADAYFARMATPPAGAKKNAIAQFVIDLKAAGVYSTLEALQIVVGDDLSDGLLNVIANALNLATNGTVNFTVNRGSYGGGGAGDYLTGWGAPNTWSKFAQNSAHYSVFVARAGAVPNGALGRAAASDNLLVSPGPLAIGARLNQASADSWDVANSIGLTTIVRPDASNVIAYRDGVSLGTKSRASTALSANARTIGRNNTDYNTDTLAIHMIGSAINSTQVAALYTACVALMAAFGWAPIAAAQTRSLSPLQKITLPDGAFADTPGKGLPCTGMARDPIDGTWWIGRGQGAALASPAGISQVSADFSTIIAEYTLGQGPLSSLSPTNVSVQGVAFDTSSNTVRFIARNTADGLQTLVVEIGRDGTLIGSFARAASNGLAYHSGRDELIWNNVGGVATFMSKLGVTSTTPPLQVKLNTSVADMMSWNAPSTLLVSSDSGPALRVMSFDNDYNTPIETHAVTLLEAEAPEGIVWYGDKFYVANDEGTHPATGPAVNSVFTYDASWMQ